MGAMKLRNGPMRHACSEKEELFTVFWKHALLEC